MTEKALFPSNLSSIDRVRLLAGLSDLSQAFVKGEQGRYGMRIPAEPYRDGDLVCGGALRLIVRQNAEIERLRAFVELCRDTFADFQMANRIIGRTLQADAARAGYDACVKCLAGETSRPACSICDDTGSMSDGTACVHLTHETPKRAPGDLSGVPGAD